jgi:arsenate reductase
MPPEATIWFNPSCSKCHTTQGILAAHGVEATYVEYLQAAPTKEQLEQVMAMLETEDPRAIARVNDPLWSTLGLDAAPVDRVLDALQAHPTLIQRPIVIVGDRAIIARPPERVLELLGERG